MLNETELIRANWIRESLPKGLKIKIALIDNKPIGFAHAIPIELGTWGITGKNSLAIPCLTLNYQKVYSQQKGSGIGRMLIKAIESDAEKHEKGVAILAYDNDFWFMPHSFFLKLGYTEVARKNKEVIMFKSFGITEPPFFTKFYYHPKLITGKVVIDVYWIPICPTSILEMLNIRKACSLFKDEVVLNEYNTCSLYSDDKTPVMRKVYINGQNQSFDDTPSIENLKSIIQKFTSKT
jgi:GNAT superfamily N-acetyltransferase